MERAHGRWGSAHGHLLARRRAFFDSIEDYVPAMVTVRVRPERWRTYDFGREFSGQGAGCELPTGRGPASAHRRAPGP